MDGHESRVEVEICGEYYTIKGDMPPEKMIELAQYVNRCMKELSKRNSRLTRTQLAVLAALNIAEEYFKLKEEYEILVKMLEPEKKSGKKTHEERPS